ncbi:MAG: CDP-alcohol phosphatidyltransferase family protein, partial [Planctomycetota bacterium]
MATDVFDGMLARRDPDRSPLGNYLDPVADKMLLMALFICLADLDVVAAWMVAALVGREGCVNGSWLSTWRRAVAPLRPSPDGGLYR